MKLKHDMMDYSLRETFRSSGVEFNSHCEGVFQSVAEICSEQSAVGCYEPLRILLEGYRRARGVHNSLELLQRNLQDRECRCVWRCVAPDVYLQRSMT